MRGGQEAPKLSGPDSTCEGADCFTSLHASLSSFYGSRFPVCFDWEGFPFSQHCSCSLGLGCSKAELALAELALAELTFVLITELEF